jgi:hypothetical protein
MLILALANGESELRRVQQGLISRGLTRAPCDLLIRGRSLACILTEDVFHACDRGDTRSAADAELLSLSLSLCPSPFLDIVGYGREAAAFFGTRRRFSRRRGF